MSGESSNRGANAASTSETITISGHDENTEDVPALRLRLHKPRSRKSVQWTEATVDNEHMNKKKSKCCCIFEKPRAFGDSSSDEDEDDDCDNCHGHVEKRKKSGVTTSDSAPTEAVSENEIGIEASIKEIVEDIAININNSNHKEKNSNNENSKNT